MTRIDVDTGFAQIRGQDKARKLIHRALASDRVPHAFLFRGPEGVGKQLFARAVAAAVNCRKSKGTWACGECSSCRKYRSGSHPDFMVISPEKGVIKIEQIRRMCQTLSYPPYESPIRVILIEDVHGMRVEAANSLLKTLEEPPPDNLLILTADSSKEILSTISSRCQLIPFYSLTVDETVEVLLECERGLDRETAGMMARLAEGSPGKAMLYWKTEMMVVMKNLAGILSKPSLDFERDAGELLQAAEMMSDLKENLPRLFGLLRIWLRDRLMVVSDLAERAVSSVDDGTRDVEWAKCWSSRRLFGTLEALDAAERQLARNCNRTLVCEVLLFSLCSPNNSFTKMASI